ncbi:MAG: hypothetical protein COA94_04685 [Rickettsiales bacterium]|nr:MAG: hypothetical protein COA94_04685 [Rickettsiales bacterium]
MPEVTLRGREKSGGGQAGEVFVQGKGILSAIWTGGGTGSAPDPEDYELADIGADLLGIATGVTYHIVGAVGSKSWVATGGTVQNLYGGA